MPPTQITSWKMELPWSLASSAEWATESATAVMGSLGAVVVVALGFVLAEAEAEAEEGFRRVMVGVWATGQSERVSEGGAEGRGQRAENRAAGKGLPPPPRAENARRTAYKTATPEMTTVAQSQPLLSACRTLF